MTKIELYDDAINLISTMLAELKAADNYLDIESYWEDENDKKTFISFAKTEIFHYNGIKAIYDKEKESKYRDIELTNPVLIFLLEELENWGKCMSDKITEKEKEYNME